MFTNLDELMRYLFLTLFFICISTSFGAIANQKPQKVLFVGNSFTYFNGGIDHHVSQLARYANPARNPITHKNAFPGETLEGHLTRRDTAQTIKMLEWDWVIIQGYSNEPLTDYARFEKYAAKLTKMSRAQGGSAQLLMTWAYKEKPAMTATLQAAYQRAAEQLNIDAIPAGPAFALSLARKPDMDLYSDSKHPNLAGTYLAACVVYQWLYDTPAYQSRYRAGLPEHQARFLQQVAADTVSQFKNNE